MPRAYPRVAHRSNSLGDGPAPVRRPWLARGAPADGPAGSRAELLACAIFLGALAAVMCAAHVGQGGFYYDDWSVLALARSHPAGGLLHALWLDYGQRPGQVAYYAALDEALGADSAARLALAAATAVLECTCAYALLRRVGLGSRDAGAIALLILTFPFSDSVWLWGILSLASLAIAAALLGVVLALRAFERTGVRALGLHSASLTLYVLSLLSYELFAVVGCLAGLVYTRSVGLRRARARWALDLVVIGGTVLVTRAVLPVDVATPSRAQSLSGMVMHAVLIARDGLRLVGEAVIPVSGIPAWAGCAAVAVVLLGVAMQRRRLGRAEPMRIELGRWLGLATAGALAALAAWAVYVPAPNHYSPIAGGTVNRVNAFAAIGIAILLYALLALLARTLGHRLRSSRAAAPWLTTALALALGFAYLERSRADARGWDAAAAEQRRELDALRPLIEHVGTHATIFVTGAPQRLRPGVPVLSTALDLTSAVRINFAKPQLAAVPLASAAAASCGPNGTLAGGVQGAYGSSYLIDLAERQAVRLTGRGRCAAATRGAQRAAGTASRAPAPATASLGRCCLSRSLPACCAGRLATPRRT